MRVTTTRWGAALARLSPPRLSRWRGVLPLEAGTGQAPHSFANAASERIRSGLSPTRSSIAAAVPAPIPCAWTSAGGGQRLEVAVVAPDLLVERQPATGDRAQAGLRRRRRRGDRPRPQGREVPDQGHLAGDAVEPLAQGGRGADDDRLQRHHGLGPSLDRGVARDLEVADHLDRAGARLRPGGGLPAEHGAGGTLGVERVALALPAPQLPVGPVDLEDGMPLCDQEARQAGAVGPGPLDAEGADRAQGPRPGLQCLVAPLADRDGRRAEAGTERVDRDGGVHVLVGVDA